MARAAAAPRRIPARSGSRAAIRWDRVGRFALLGVLGVILLLYISPAKHWIQQSRTAGEQSAELDQLKTEHKQLQERVKRMRDPAALEREARKLGMVREGERPFVIENLPKR